MDETPAFREAVGRGSPARVPLGEVLARHGVALVRGPLSIVVCYALFFISIVFARGYAVSTRQMPRSDVLGMLCGAVFFMALATPLSAALANRFGRRPRDDRHLAVEARPAPPSAASARRRPPSDGATMSVASEDLPPNG